ncbi:hypothetical protein N9L68_06315 [bacterium]|nr:hypothetical protein [bacterium]
MSGCDVIEIDIVAVSIDKYDKWTTREICAWHIIVDEHQTNPKVIGVADDATATLKLVELHFRSKQIEYDIPFPQCLCNILTVTLLAHDPKCIPIKRRRQPLVNIVTPHPQTNEPIAPNHPNASSVCE